MLFGLASPQCQHSSLGTLHSLQQHWPHRPLLQHTVSRRRRYTVVHPRTLAPPNKDTQNSAQSAEQLQAAADLDLISSDQHGQSADADIGTKKTSNLRGAGRVLRALCHYSPQDLSDGPASLSKVRCLRCICKDPMLVFDSTHCMCLDAKQWTLVCCVECFMPHVDLCMGYCWIHNTTTPAQPGAPSSWGQVSAHYVLQWLLPYHPAPTYSVALCLAVQVRPYSASQVEAALQHAMQQQLLPKLDLQQLSNIACALAAAGHLKITFMQHLGDIAAAQIRSAPRLLQPAQSLKAFRALCWLAVGFARLGVLHPQLMEQIALYGGYSK